MTPQVVQRAGRYTSYRRLRPPMYDMTATHKASTAAKAFRDSGQDSRERGREKTLKVLEWVYRWRWIAPDLVPQLVGAQSRGFASGLVAKGLLHEVQTYQATASGCPGKILFLTKAGHRLLLESGFFNRRNYTFGNRFNEKLLMHDSVVQRVTLEWLQSERRAEEQPRDYITQYEYRDDLPVDALGPKRPDVVWLRANTSGDLLMTAIEVELTRKNAEQLPKFRRQCIQMLEKRAIEDVLILAPSTGLLEAYAKALAAHTEWTWTEELTGLTQFERISADDARRFKFTHLAGTPMRLDREGVGQLLQVTNPTWLRHSAEHQAEETRPAPRRSLWDLLV